MYLINGKEVTKKEFQIPVEDLVIWRGDGIFEAIGIHKGFLFALEEHIERFKQSAQKMHFDNIDFNKIEKDLVRVASNYDSGYMRVIIGRGPSKEDSKVYMFYQDPIPVPEYYSLQSHKAHWMSGGDFEIDEVNNIAAKSTSYAMNMSHTRLAEKEGFTDSLLLNKDNIVLEGPSFSIAWIKAGKVFVPDLDLGILDSVTRRSLIKIGDNYDLNVSIERISIEDLYEVDSVLVLSTAKHARFVNKIDNKEYSEDKLLPVIRTYFKEQIEREKSRKLSN
ncbi:MAG: aminotransferase class IV [Candidatus Actinomarina sp.]